MRGSFAICLVIASAVHAAALMRLPDVGLAEAAGDGGETLISLAAAPASLAAVVETWETQPKTGDAASKMEAPTSGQSPELTPTKDSSVRADQAALLPQEAPGVAPDRPQTAAPMVADVAVTDGIALPVPKSPDAPKAPAPELAALTPETTRPSVDTSAPEARLAPRTSERPKPRRIRQAAPASAPSKPQRAQGSGGGQTAGQTQRAETSSLSPSQRQSLMARWGNRIRSQIERGKGSARGSGRVVVALRVGANGALQSVGIAKSSGNSRLDQAAISAVKRAGRFPRAPAALGGEGGYFSLPIAFSS